MSGYVIVENKGRDQEVVSPTYQDMFAAQQAMARSYNADEVEELGVAVVFKKEVGDVL